MRVPFFFLGHPVQYVEIGHRFFNVFMLRELVDEIVHRIHVVSEIRFYYYYIVLGRFDFIMCIHWCFLGVPVLLSLISSDDH